jgi:hypothetical protein
MTHDIEIEFEDDMGRSLSVSGKVLDDPGDRDTPGLCEATIDLVLDESGKPIHLSPKMASFAEERMLAEIGVYY